MFSKLRDPFFARQAAGAGAVLLAVCVGITAYRNYTFGGAGPEACAADAGVAASQTLEVVKVAPAEAALDRDICFVVNGVVAPGTEPSPDDVVLYVFLNGKLMPGLSADKKPVSQTVRARKQSGQQSLPLRLEAPDSATPELAAFWRNIARGGTWGWRQIELGVSTSETTIPASGATATFKLALIYPLAFVFGALALVAFAVSFWSLALTTTILRDNQRTLADVDRETGSAKEEAQRALEQAEAASAAVAADAGATPEAMAAAQANLAAARAGVAAAAQLAGAVANRVEAEGPGAPVGSYSLSRTQMALWLFLTVTGFIYIWFSVGQTIDVVTSQIVTLLGIQAATGIAAVMADNDSAAKRNSESFLTDILNNGDGPKVHRVQALAWTVVLALIFIWNVVWNFVFVQFDQSLLLLMGVTQTVYVGFKYQGEAK